MTAHFVFEIWRFYGFSKVPARVLQLGTTFFRVNNFVNRTRLRLISTLFHNVFKFLSVPGQLSLEVNNMPGSANVLGWNLTRICFFFQTGNKIVGQLFVCLSVIGLVVTSWNCFFFAARIFLQCCF